MAFDPFADDNDDIEETVTVTVPTDPQTEVSVTLKGGAGFDSPWVVLRAPDPATALELLNDGTTVKDLLDKAATVGSYFAAKGGSGSSNGGAQRPARQEAPGGEKRFCSHGEMTYRSGVSKNTGKPYKMFACPERDRSAQCEPEFLR